jgi:hypothetical protein
MLGLLRGLVEFLVCTTLGHLAVVEVAAEVGELDRRLFEVLVGSKTCQSDVTIVIPVEKPLGWYPRALCCCADFLIEAVALRVSKEGTVAELLRNGGRAVPVRSLLVLVVSVEPEELARVSDDLRERLACELLSRWELEVFRRLRRIAIGTSCLARLRRGVHMRRVSELLATLREVASTLGAF